MPPHIAAQCAPPSSPVSKAPPTTSQSSGIVVVLDQDIDRWGVEIVELSAPHRPDERPDRRAEQQYAQGNQQQEDAHVRTPGVARDRRNALSVTTSEDRAIPMAASQGVTSPSAASGSAKTL